ncbi:MAG: aromatic-ring-hydroxylating dioxygenase subunit beta [Pseudomonadales bacterium]|nr:aromatic-ring-hydroxylating dioxygenase subunit beta [Pseudomonadales bacterium]
MTTIISANPSIRDIEQLLYQEASFLDKPDLDRWIELYTEDGTYWMPAREDQEDPEFELSHIYDDHVMMEIRRRNFVHPRAASKDYKIRCSHIISNIQMAELDASTGDCTITSNFHALVNYMGEQRMYGGSYTHRLTKDKDGYKIRHKRVDLINCEEPQKSMIIYL